MRGLSSASSDALGDDDEAHVRVGSAGSCNKSDSQLSQAEEKLIIQKECAQVVEDSQVLNLNKMKHVPRFAREELTLGRVLGTGGFGRVNEITNIQLVDIASRHSQHSSTNIDASSELLETTSSDEGSLGCESRQFITEHCIRRGGSEEPRYALKCLKPDVVADPDKVNQGMMDLFLETSFLACLEHPNIIKLRAMAAGDPINRNYFIVVDKLGDTLAKRILTWAKEDKKATGIMSVIMGKKTSRQNTILEKQLHVAFDLSAALGYLHERNIIHRDLKPANVGFNIRGDVVLFDFGLAKEFHPRKDDVNGTFNLTANTGSLRYMAPEVALGKPYNNTVDVYSFAIMLWEMLALQRPFAKHDRVNVFRLEVIRAGDRPSIDPKWPLQVQTFLKQSWSENITIRPSMKMISIILKREVTKLRNGNDKGLDHNFRRSTFVFQKHKHKKT